MVVPNREIANKNFTHLDMFNLADFNYISKNIQMDAPRDIPRDRVINNNPNYLRKSSLLSRASSIGYEICMKIQSKDFSWANQTESELFLLFLMSPIEKKGQAIKYWQTIFLTVMYLIQTLCITHPRR